MDILNNGIKLGTEKIQRPLMVTILCIVGGVIRIPLGLIIFVLAIARKLTLEGKKDLVVFLFIFSAEFIGLIGFWKMRKWGVYSYAVGSLCGLVYSLLSKWNPAIYQYMTLFIFISIGMFYYKRMR